MSRRPDFTKNIEMKIRTKNAPQSLSDFLGETPMQQEDRKEYNENKVKREEFRFPIEMAEKLRAVSFKLNKKKTEIVQEALNMYFEAHPTD